MNSIRIVSVGLNASRSFADTSGSAVYLGTVGFIVAANAPIGKAEKPLWGTTNARQPGYS